MSSDPAAGLRWENLRRGQRLAVEAIIQRYISGKDYTAIILPTRYGKSDVIRFAVAALWLMGKLPCALVLTPSVVLRRQMMKKDDWTKARDRYGLPALAGKQLESWADLQNPTANNEVFLVASTQLAVKHVETLADWVESVIARTGQAPLIIVDECHTGSDDNTWGGALKDLVAKQARGVLMTATAYRSDGVRLPGFNYEKIREEALVYHIVRPAEDPEKVHMEKYAGTRTVYRLIADHETSFKEAWRTKCLCRIERRVFDVDLEQIGMAAEAAESLLSQLTDQRLIRKALGKGVRDAQVIRTATQMLVEWLLTFRARARRAAAIVFCGNDDASEVGINHHAQMIKAAILRENPSLKVVIATSASDDASIKSSEARGIIERFQDNDDGDVLIVKQMAGLGFDCARVKVLLDLSTTRTDSACVQRWTRPATPYDVETAAGTITIYNCALIKPFDLPSERIFEQWVKNEDGECASTEAALIAQFDVPKKPPAERPDFLIKGAREGQFSDNDGNSAPPEMWGPTNAMFHQEPKLSSLFTHAEFAALMQRWGHGPHPEPPRDEAQPVHDTGKAAADLRAQVRGLHRQIVMSMLGREYEQQVYAATCSEVYTALYRAEDVPYRTELKTIADLTVLQRLIARAQEWLRGGQAGAEVARWAA